MSFVYPKLKKKAKLYKTHAHKLDNMEEMNHFYPKGTKMKK